MRALSREEQALFDEMKERCLAKGQYKDEKAKDKFKMLCHLEDFEIQYWELLKENKKLKECYCNRTDCSGRIKNSRKYDSLYQKYNKQLDNWNKLKEYLNYKSERAVGEDEYVYDEIYNELQELEKRNNDE